MNKEQRKILINHARRTARTEFGAAAPRPPEKIDRLNRSITVDADQLYHLLYETSHYDMAGPRDDMFPCLAEHYQKTKRKINRHGDAVDNVDVTARQNAEAFCDELALKRVSDCSAYVGRMAEIGKEAARVAIEKYNATKEN